MKTLPLSITVIFVSILITNTGVVSAQYGPGFSPVEHYPPVNDTALKLLVMNSIEFKERSVGYNYTLAGIDHNWISKGSNSYDFEGARVIFFVFGFENGTTKGDVFNIDSQMKIKNVFEYNADNPPVGYYTDRCMGCPLETGVTKPKCCDPYVPILLKTPLKQFKSGVALKDIKCAADLQLLIKANSHLPACVKPDDVSKLVERGWADKPNSLQEQLDLEHTCIGPNIACRNVASNSLSESDCGEFHTVPENHTSLNTVPVLLMKTNSTACAKLRFTIISNYNDCNGPNCQHVLDVKPTGLISNLHYEKHGDSFSITPGKDYDNSFKIVAIPSTVDLANYPVGTNYTVTYIIRPLANATGFYDQSIPRLVCERYPLAVGYTADQVNASDFSYIDILNPPCALGAYGLTKVEVSGMDYKEVTLRLAVLEQVK